MTQEATTQATMRATQSRDGREARMRFISGVMANLCIVASMLLTLAMAYYWFATPGWTLIADAHLVYLAPGDFTIATRGVSFLISMVPLGVLIWGLFQARCCFRSLAAGRIFATETVVGLRRFALAVFFASLLKPLAGAALSMFLSWGGPKGTRMLSISLGSDMLLALLFAGTILIIAWIMSEAIAIADENAQFV